jgi:hypothetical protein
MGLYRLKSPKWGHSQQKGQIVTNEEKNAKYAKLTNLLHMLKSDERAVIVQIRRNAEVQVEQAKSEFAARIGEIQAERLSLI